MDEWKPLPDTVQVHFPSTVGHQVVELAHHAMEYDLTVVVARHVKRCQLTQ